MKDQEASYLVLTDLFCGTPYNASCAVAMKHPEREIEVVSGMSLPIVLEVASMLGSRLQDIVNHATSIPCDTVKAFKQQLIEEEEDF
jgi:mannose/fructose-specific phosphotransferase system component IIA